MRAVKTVLHYQVAPTKLPQVLLLANVSDHVFFLKAINPKLQTKKLRDLDLTSYTLKLTNIITNTKHSYSPSLSLPLTSQGHYELEKCGTQKMITGHVMRQSVYQQEYK